MESLSTFWLSVLLFVLILASAFFSASETSMMALNRYRLKTLSSKNNLQAQRVERLLKNIDYLIGGILLGNNFVNILAASIATLLALKIWGEGSVIIASLALTLVILIFAENTPKTFAAKNPEKIALPASWLLDLLIKIFKPLIYLISLISKSILNFLGLKNISKDILNSEELRMAVVDSKSVLSKSYQNMLLNIIDLEKVKVDDIMIPHHELVSADINNEEELFEQLKRIQHTRLLIFDGSENNIIGTIHMRDVVNIYARDEINMAKIKEIIREPYFIPEGTPLSQQLEHFKTQKRRLGIVVDEYGEVQGMVVLDDILEEIVGQFTSSQGESIDEINIQSDGSYLVDPRISIRELNAKLKVSLPFDNAKTLNGLILEQLQSFPQHNVSFKVDSLIIEIVQVNKQGVKLVKITKVN
ncbi:CNNM domain-containing protein [Candidatus Thioglobus sp.]|uniref:HlyC/CorC family transporter n=1 Tax=Candidatus Pseudothioglobus sp. Uisw_050_01 TaxID=3230997 RepID=UPI0023044479|nr:CNNM domain-containing protein [Candidatus Thioglobus sp.]MDB4057507.1 CNNM domain-containing protein [Candidatus Thioglobus sp.]MDC1447165.1 CNNM domain-containing protein [Candidatus Thioglobus sp.]MDC1450245.1 CNNM domain-containing protein [Candidatus Thioglobus sp.]